MYDFELDDKDESKPSHWRRLGTLLLVVLAVLVFELSSNASVGVAIACLKFAWDDVADAFWLWRVDPIKRRGRACALIHAAVGLIKASLCGFIGGIAIAVAVQTFGRRWGWPAHVAEAQLVGAALITVFGLMMSAFLSFFAVILAWLAGIKLWVGPEVRMARQHNEWPPYARTAANPRRNQATAPLLAGIGGAGCAVILGMCVLFIALTSAKNGGPDPNSNLFFGGIILFVITAAALMLGLNDFINQRIKAHHPYECWPEISGHILKDPIATIDDFA